MGEWDGPSLIGGNFNLIRFISMISATVIIIEGKLTCKGFEVPVDGDWIINIY
jgi:hypothetical protein